MSFAYFINSLGKYNDYGVDLLAFKQELEKSPLVFNIKNGSLPSYPLRWELYLGEHELLAGLQSDLQTITIEGRDYPTIAALVMWYRALVPQVIKLFLWKASTFDTPVELTPEITEDEVVKALIQIDLRS